MNDMSPNPRAVMGANLPPPVDPEILAPLQSKVNGYGDLVGQYLDMGQITVEADAQRANDILKGLGDFKTEIDGERVRLKAPHDEAAKAVQECFAPMLAAVDAGVKALKPMVGDWLKREKARKEAEAVVERERLAAAVAEAQAAVDAAQARNDVVGLSAAQTALKAAEKAHAKAGGKPVKATVASATGGGRTRGLRKVRTVQIASLGLAAAHYRDHPEIAETLLRLANADLRAGVLPDDLPGFNVIETEELA